MKSKRLTLDEIYRVYQLLRPAIEGREQKELLVDEVLNLLDYSPDGTLVACLNILYDNISIEMLNPLEAGLYFIRGLKKNDLFEFVDFVRKLS